MVRLYLTKRSGYPATRPVSVRLSIRRHRGHRLTFGLPLKVAPKDWHDQYERLKPSVPRATEINASLKDWKAEVVAMVADGQDDDAIRARLLERAGRAETVDAPDVPTVLARYDAFTAAKASRVRASTLHTYNALRAHLVGFLASARTESMTPGEIGPAFLDDFVQFMTSEGYANSTANKMLTRLRGFLTWLAERGEIERTPAAKRLPTVKGDVLYLRTAELARLQNLDLSEATDGVRDALDVLLICSATGQRFSDVSGMEWSEIDGLIANASAPLTWSITERKNSVVRHVPLVGFASRIVRRRHAEGCTHPTPRLSNPFVNRELKGIAAAAGLDRPVTVVKTVGGERIQETRPLHECVTTHIGRKTFVTLALQSGMDAQELLGLTHDDLRTLRHYAGHDAERRRDQMNQAFGAK